MRRCGEVLAVELHFDSSAADGPVDAGGVANAPKVAWQLRRPGTSCAVRLRLPRLRHLGGDHHFAAARKAAYPRPLLKKLHTGVVVHGPDTQVVYANLRAAELLGLSEAQMLGKTVIDPGWHFVDGLGQRIDPPQYPVSRVLTTRQALKETDFGVIAPPRDHITWLSVTAFPEFDDAGQIERVVVSFHDISERKQAQADFERARAFALSVLDGLSASVCVLDMHGTILAVNRSWKEFYVANGGSAGVLHVGMNYLQVAGAATTSSDQPGALPRSRICWSKCWPASAITSEWEYPCHSPATKRWFIARVSCMKGVHPMRVVVAHDDITAVKQAQESAREALQFSQNLIDSMQDGFSVLDHTGRAPRQSGALSHDRVFSRRVDRPGAAGSLLAAGRVPTNRGRLSQNAGDQGRVRVGLHAQERRTVSCGRRGVYLVG